MFTNKDEAIYYIENIKRKEKRTNLNRMQEALNMLGNPQNAYKVIHVAGTNGKGSTVSYLTNILCEAGFNVGSFISPYVITFNERIMYNLNYISVFFYFFLELIICCDYNSVSASILSLHRDTVNCELSNLQQIFINFTLHRLLIKNIDKSQYAC